MNAQVGPRRMWRAASVAAWLDLPVHRVYDLVRRKKIPHVRIGRQVRFPPDALEAWAASGGSDDAGSDD